MNKKKIIFRVVTDIIIAVILLITLFPIIWMMPAAFKDKIEIWTLPVRFFPKTLNWVNFEKLFSLPDMNFITTLGTTFLVSVVATIISLVVNGLAGFAFARIEFHGKKIIFAYIIFMMCVPGTTILLTSIRVVNILNIVDTFWVLILPSAAGPYFMFFFRQFFLGMPESIEEAAILDGCNMWMVFLRIYMPMSATPFIIMGFSAFIAHWNDYLWPTLTVSNNTDLKQVMQVISVLDGRFNGQYGVVVAASLIASVIPIVSFAFVQRKIVGGIAIYGLK